MSGSNMELDHCSQQGLVESPTSSLRGLSSSSLPTASTDNLIVDTGKYHSHSYFGQVKGIYLNIWVVQVHLLLQRHAQGVQGSYLSDTVSDKAKNL